MVNIHRRVPALMVLLAAIAMNGCNQRAPFLDQAAVTTAPSVIVPAPPTGISSIVFSPPGNRGGTSGRGTVYLDAPSRDGARLVSLTSSDASVVSVSPQVVIPDGAVSGDFSFTTRPVQRDVNVTITASSGERSISDYVSVWTPATSFIAYSADPGVANPALLVRSSSDAGARFTSTCNNGVVVTFVNTPGRLIDMWFARQVGQPMRPGIYDASGDTSGNFIVNGAANNCQILGRFEVHEFGVLANGTVNSLWVSFEHGCRNKPGTIRGVMNVSGPGAAGTAQCVRVR